VVGTMVIIEVPVGSDLISVGLFAFLKTNTVLLLSPLFTLVSLFIRLIDLVIHCFPDIKLKRVFL